MHIGNAGFFLNYIFSLYTRVSFLFSSAGVGVGGREGKKGGEMGREELAYLSSWLFLGVAFTWVVVGWDILFGTQRGGWEKLGGWRGGSTPVGGCMCTYVCR
jgi:hypothetical protein